MLNSLAKNKIYEYVTRNLGMRDYVRGWLKGTCPSCNREGKYGVNLGTNRTNCFVCGYHPSPINLVVDQENLSSTHDAWIFLKTYEGLEYLEPVIERIETSNVILPEGYVNIKLGDSRLSHIMRGYVKRRGFDIDEVALKGWGYCRSGEHFGYLILPFYMGGKLVYYNGRLVVGSGPKYINPTIEQFGTGKSLILYNADALAIYDDIYLVEGLINAETLGDNALASGGKAVADYQISMIIKSQVSKITVVLDPDAINNSIKVCMQMAFHKQIRLVTWEGEQDINDIGKEEAFNRIETSPWLSYNDLLKLKHEKGA